MAKHPGGRPTDYRPEYCQSVVDYMATGAHVHEFAASIGVAKSTVYKWAEDNEEFSDALKKAMDASVAVWLRQAQKKAFGEVREGSDALLIWMLKVKDRTSFGDDPINVDKSTTNITLTPEQAKKVIKAVEE